MTDERAGVVIVGAGLLGLAAAASLTGRGREVVVLEQAAIGHRRSGSQGSSRIFRLGYADPLYVEMARLARGRWQELEAFAGVDLLLPWPQLSFGADLRPLHDALEAAGSRVEWMNAEAVARRFPGFRPRGDALYEPDSGVLLADRCLAALARAATDGGAEIREGVAVSMIDDDGAGVTVTTSAGVIRADVAVVCGGAWSGALVASVAPEASVDFAPTLEHVVYAAPTSGTSLESLPIFIDHDHPSAYGLPTPALGRYKVAWHHGGPPLDPEGAWTADPTAAAHAVELVGSWLPGCDPANAIVETCPYDNTPDEDFVLDRTGNVVIGAGTSGHGFKFGPLLGDVLADLATGVTPPVDVARFAARR